jgi:hypothetical protein|nr:MAG TPA: hypothetical protein [Caudoviricetes sp.]
MFEILKVTAIFESGRAVKYRGEEITALMGTPEVSHIGTARKIIWARIKDLQEEPRNEALGAVKRVILVYREKEQSINR